VLAAAKIDREPGPSFFPSYRSAITPTMPSRENHMVSIDHFAHELRTQLKRAAEQGATNILIRTSELCRSVRMGTSSMDAGCDAMQNEIKPGDVVVLDRNSGAGMTVRYLLPR
jgi:hypothetical protein